jgi:putative phosphoribosyl transferase
LNRNPLFSSRVEAGRLLAGRIAQRGFRQPVVLTLPGPGVAIALELARSLQAPLDVVVPYASGHPDAAAACACSRWEEAEDALDAGAPQPDLRRREQFLRHGRVALRLEGQTCLLADDGSASVADLRSALHRLRSAKPRRVVLATPIVRSTTLAALRDELDGCIHLFEVTDPDEVGVAFQDPGSRSEGEVAELLERAWSDGAS